MKQVQGDGASSRGALKYLPYDGIRGTIGFSDKKERT